MGAEIISTKPKRSTPKIVKDSTLAGLGNLIKLLPTGTVFLFHFFNPLLTNYGRCSSCSNTNMTVLLIAMCGISCAFSCFTDSYIGVDGQIHYGIVTNTGIWPGTAAGMADLSRYKLQIGDIVHAIFSALLYGAVAFTDHNTVGCFHRDDLHREDKTKLMIVPALVGIISSFFFSIFPNKRHGVGYPSEEYPEIPE